MQYFGKAEDAANDILAAFAKPESLPEPLAQLFIHQKDGVPCRQWSWRNQFLAAIHGYDDARGYRQWAEADRQVRKGEKAFYILSPCTKKVEDEKTGEERIALTGFRGTPVFGLEQTEGALLPTVDSETQKWIQSLPLFDVAESWGLTVKPFNGAGADKLGAYRRSSAIALGVKNLSTWAHELVHAADDRNCKLVGKKWQKEIVAELGGAVLLRLLGFDDQSDLGGCWEYIQRHTRGDGTTELDACNKVLQRTCEAVDLILSTAESLAAEESLVA